MYRYFAFFAFFAACTPTEVPPEMAEQNLNLKATGLYLTANPLDAPPGALAEATNAVIRRRDVVEPRRGQRPDATVPGSAYADALASFEGELLEHSSAGGIGRRTSDTTITPYSGTFTAPTGEPTRFAEATGGLYVTTNAGPYRLDSPTSEWVPAGTPPGLEGKAETTGSTGWLANGETVGYRVVWGSRDGDGQLLEGAPSGRFLVTNAAGGARDVLITTPIPDGVRLDVHFIQIYRTALTTTGGADPGEDMAQVGEYFPTPTDLSNGYLTFTDIASFASGPTGYFSPSLGVGIAGSKEQPPLITDAVVFNGYMFGVVQAYRQGVQMALLAVGSGGGALEVGDGLIISDGTTTETYTAALSESVPNNFLHYTSGTAAENIATTAQSLVRAINSRTNGLIYATYAASTSDLPGKMVFTSRAVGGAPLSVSAVRDGTPWLPRMASTLGVTANRIASTVTLDTGGNPHNLSPGDTFTLLPYYGVPSDELLFPPGVKTVATVPAINQLTYTEAGTAGSAAGSLTIATMNQPVEFTQEATGNDYALSDLEEPDAWPPRFRFKVGGPNTRLYRIVPQGSALLFFTSDGIYRLNGRTADEFTLFPLDATARLVGMNTPVSLNNQALALTTRGLVAISDLGVEKISEPIELMLLDYYAGDQATNTRTAAFAFPYETENEYWLFLQSPDAEEGGPATRAYVFNAQTGTWVGPQEFEWAGLNEGTKAVRSGLVHSTGDGRLYLGAGTKLTRERKARALADYQDTDGVGIPFDVATVVNTQKNPGALKQWVEQTIMLEQPQPASCEVYFTTELDSAEEGATLTSQGNAALRTYIPLNKSRSARLTVGLRHSTAQEKPAILGYSTVANISSTRVGR